MIQEIKLGFRLLKYGYKLKMNLIMLCVFLVIGIAVEIVSKGTNLIGGFYMLLVGLFVFQLIVSMDISEYVQSSPLKRKLQVSMPVLSSTVVYLVLYIVLVIERFILISLYPQQEEQLLSSFIMIMGYFFFASIYTGICYKYFICSSLMFVISIIAFTSIYTIAIRMVGYSFLIDLGMPRLALISFGLLVAGIFLEYLMTTLLYKKPLSKLAFSGFFKDMK